jgi:hypothetical protein
MSGTACDFTNSRPDKIHAFFLGIDIYILQLSCLPDYSGRDENLIFSF